MDPAREILDLPPDARELVAECELTGKRTILTRSGRPVVALVSYDEYLALRETVEIANDPLFVAGVNEAEEEAHRSEFFPMDFERLRIAASVEQAWNKLDDDERAQIETAFALIEDDPIAGAPLFDPLRGLWSHRTGALRIVYRIVAEARFIVILGIAKVP
ncbi:MAG TPA: type II toxin-antitoxin system prevent-host-death family antitoxin [Thermoanaerobaculia bacterium]|nr:type II toxin-antitoxin system prevent-host-death family antitoxin [Thermoanaerobaculia bacterium]